MTYDYTTNPVTNPGEWDAVSPKVLAALHQVHEVLLSGGIRHVLVGGLALDPHGVSRNTKDIDFIAGEEAFRVSGKVVSFAPGVPFQIDGVAIDYVAIDPRLAEVVNPLLDASSTQDGIVVVPVTVLVAMKLKAHRMRDRADVAALIEAGADVPALRTFLQTYTPELLDRLDAIVDDITLRTP